jgi:hypothetical protein
MGRLIFWIIVLLIAAIVATLFMGGGYLAAAVIRDLGLTSAIVVWIVALLFAILIVRVVARKYRDYRAIYGQSHHGGRP